MNNVNNSLARAASEGSTEVVKCLLEAGANPNRPDEVTFSIFSQYHNELLESVVSKVLGF